MSDICDRADGVAAVAAGVRGSAASASDSATSTTAPRRQVVRRPMTLRRRDEDLAMAATAGTLLARAPEQAGCREVRPRSHDVTDRVA